jgi:hypothetical protein
MASIMFDKIVWDRVVREKVVFDKVMCDRIACKNIGGACGRKRRRELKSCVCVCDLAYFCMSQ